LLLLLLLLLPEDCGGGGGGAFRNADDIVAVSSSRCFCLLYFFGRNAMTQMKVPLLETGPYCANETELWQKHC
jgi:hypothetical protein